jgi:hypothetical protein
MSLLPVGKGAGEAPGRTEAMHTVALALYSAACLFSSADSQGMRAINAIRARGEAGR